jgi:dipeptidyl aminopeptidase/acylaminoacyl peptidase
VKTLLVMIAAFPAVAGASERVLTTRAAGHLIHNSQVFSRDGRHIVFDSRNDETQLATSARIGMVEIASGRETVIYETSRSSSDGPGVGAATFSPVADEVVFIHGLDHAGPEQPYAAHRRSAALVSLAVPGKMARLDARDITAPFTPGALRGGTHAHHWSGDGEMLSFTYNDAVVRAPGPPPADLRTIGVIARRTPVTVADPRPGDDFSGLGFTVVVVPVKAAPAPGELSRACEEGWVGTKGYLRPDGSRQGRALAFIGSTVAADGKPITEVFIADLPDDLTRPGVAPLEGTSTEMPAPPDGVAIRRLTHTENTSRPGLQGPRHWLRASPDGSVIAFLDEDAEGIVQIFGVSPNGGDLRPLSRLRQSVDTPFTWSPCGRFLATSAGGRIVRIAAATGSAEFLTPPSAAGRQPRHGVVFSPDGKQLAYNRMLPHPDGGIFLQICLLSLPGHR